MNHEIKVEVAGGDDLTPSKVLVGRTVALRREGDATTLNTLHGERAVVICEAIVLDDADGGYRYAGRVAIFWAAIQRKMLSTPTDVWKVGTVTQAEGKGAKAGAYLLTTIDADSPMLAAAQKAITAQARKPKPVADFDEATDAPF